MKIKLCLIFFFITNFLNGFAQSNFKINSVKSDATSALLNWNPILNIKAYIVYRNNTNVGTTRSKTGYFSDFNLIPNQTYQYNIVAIDSNNIQNALSDTISVTTKNVSAIRTHYKVLVVAFYPTVIDINELTGIKTFLKHRLDFFRLASFGSAILEAYKNDVITIKATPPILFQGNFNINFSLLVNAPYAELDGYSIVDLIEKGDVDLVWITKAPDGCNFHENYLVGNLDIGNANSTGEKWISDKVGCSRSFFVNCYSSDERCNDAYAHNIEGVMSSICDGYPDNWPRDKEYVLYTHTISDFTTKEIRNLHLFERFRLADEWGGMGSYASKGNGNCGTSHFPPNSPRYIDTACTGYCYSGDYAYFFNETWKNYIDCVADDWLNYPNFDNVKRKLNGFDFGAFNYYAENDSSYSTALGTSPELHSSFSFSASSYHHWWFSHIPHNPGVSNGKLNNWWFYIFDFNRFNGCKINYLVTGFPDIPDVFQSNNNEYGTEEITSDNWGYWHSNNSFSPFGKYGKISAVNKDNNPTFVKNGNASLMVYVENTELYENSDRGANEIYYPRFKNAHWDLSAIDSIKFSIKLGENPNLIVGTNPIIKLCKNGGNRIEMIPIQDGYYKNLFSDTTSKDANGWYNFTVPVSGNSKWEKNIIGYIDSELNLEDKDAEKLKIEKDILSEVNYVVISVKSTRVKYPLDSCSFYIDDLEFVQGKNTYFSSFTDDFTNNIKVYPNPTSGSLNISLSESMECDYNIELYSLQCMLQTYSKLKKTTQIDLSGYPSGIYFLKVSTKNKLYHIKIIKK